MKSLLQFGAGAAGLALMLTSGCRLFLDDEATVQGRSLLRPAAASPDSVAMEIVWARFADGDPQLNESAWQQIDETSIAPDVQRELAKNGFRAGVIRGALPDELSRALRQGEKTTDTEASEGDPTLASFMTEPTIRRRLVQARRQRRIEIQASDVIPTLPLLIGKGDELGGGTYHDAQGIYALEVDPQPDRTVLVEMTPELHHGSPRMRWSKGEEGVFRQSPMREHEVFERLRLTVKLSPGEMLVLMSRPEASSRLGQYFHTVDAGEGRQQKLILVRVAQVPQGNAFAGTGG
jgi:hypothetical protein